LCGALLRLSGALGLLLELPRLLDGCASRLLGWAGNGPANNLGADSVVCVQSRVGVHRRRVVLYRNVVLQGSLLDLWHGSRLSLGHGHNRERIVAWCEDSAKPVVRDLDNLALHGLHHVVRVGQVDAVEVVPVYDELNRLAGGAPM